MHKLTKLLKLASLLLTVAIKLIQAIRLMFDLFA